MGVKEEFEIVPPAIEREVVIDAEVPKENFVVVKPVVSPSAPMVETEKAVEPEAVEEEVTTMEPVVLPSLKLKRFMWSRKVP